MRRRELAAVPFRGEGSLSESDLQADTSMEKGVYLTYSVNCFEC